MGRFQGARFAFGTLWFLSPAALTPKPHCEDRNVFPQPGSLEAGVSRSPFFCTVGWPLIGLRRLRFRPGFSLLRFLGLDLQSRVGLLGIIARQAPALNGFLVVVDLSDWMINLLIW